MKALGGRLVACGAALVALSSPVLLPAATAQALRVDAAASPGGDDQHDGLGADGGTALSVSAPAVHDLQTPSAPPLILDPGDGGGLLVLRGPEGGEASDRAGTGGSGFDPGRGLKDSEWTQPLPADPPLESGSSSPDFTQSAGREWVGHAQSGESDDAPVFGLGYADSPLISSIDTASFRFLGEPCEEAAGAKDAHVDVLIDSVPVAELRTPVDPADGSYSLELVLPAPGEAGAWRSGQTHVIDFLYPEGFGGERCSTSQVIGLAEDAPRYDQVIRNAPLSPTAVGEREPTSVPGAEPPAARRASDGYSLAWDPSSASWTATPRLAPLLELPVLLLEPADPGPPAAAGPRLLESAGRGSPQGARAQAPSSPRPPARQSSSHDGPEGAASPEHPSAPGSALSAELTALGLMEAGEDTEKAAAVQDAQVLGASVVLSGAMLLFLPVGVVGHIMASSSRKKP